MVVVIVEEKDGEITRMSFWRVGSRFAHVNYREDFA